MATSMSPSVLGPRRRRVFLTDAQVRRLRKRYAAGGISQAELALQYGISQPGVCLMLIGQSRRRAGGPITRRGAPRRLTDRQVRHMRQLYADGVGPSALSERFDVSYSTVYRVIRGRAYRDVGGPISR